MKAVPINLEKISDLVGKEVVNNTKFNKPTKVNNLKGKIPYAVILIHINQYNTDKIIGDRNWRCLLKKYPTLVVY